MQARIDGKIKTTHIHTTNGSLHARNTGVKTKGQHATNHTAVSTKQAKRNAHARIEAERLHYYIRSKMYLVGFQYKQLV